MIIFGIRGGKRQDHGPAMPVVCPNCNNQTFYRYAISRKWFRLYFIPLIPYSIKHLLFCPVCTRAFQLDRSQIPAVKALVQQTAAWNRSAISEDQYLETVRTFWASGMTQVLPPQAALPASLGQLPSAPTGRQCTNGHSNAADSAFCSACGSALVGT